MAEEEISYMKPESVRLPGSRFPRILKFSANKGKPKLLIDLKKSHSYEAQSRSYLRQVLFRGIASMHMMLSQ